MSEGGENQSVFGKMPNKSWARKGRKADLSGVSIDKVRKAAKRGIRIEEAKKSPEGKVTVEVNKVVVKGDDK